MRNSLAALAALALAGCGAQRPFIATQPHELADLYARGELTDRAGNVWNVKVLPGVVPPIERAGESFQESGEWMTRYADEDYYQGLTDELNRGLRFAAEDGLNDMIVEGIPRDLAETSERIAELGREAPFGWIVRIFGRAIWGFAIVPAGRTAIGGAEIALGTAYGVLAPPVALAGRPVVAAGNAALFGVVVPAATIAVHQPIYLATIVNREPRPDRDDGGILVEIKERAEERATAGQ